MKIKTFTFNPYAENTYILYDDTGECAIVDPGCYGRAEEKQLDDFISSHKLTPVRLINTHCHIDHVFGVPFVVKNYGLKLEIHKGEKIVLGYTEQVGKMYGTPSGPMPEPGGFLDEGDLVKFGKTQLEIYFTPGHSPASICFYHREEGQLICGDVLFKGSIGRTDLPGGNHDTLMNSIFDKLMPLDDDVVVYPGHMESTTIGDERKRNPFLHEWLLRKNENEN
jgi:glyoxylase-like metal-dependent hydrolase (beta-lactamase superfamily II)